MRRKGVHDPRRIDQRRTGIDRYCNPKSLGNFLACRSVANGGIGMDRNTSVAAHRDCHSQRDQLTNLGAKKIGLQARSTKSCLTPHGVRADTPDLTDACGYLLPISVPVEHHGPSPAVEPPQIPFLNFRPVAEARSASTAGAST